MTADQNTDLEKDVNRFWALLFEVVLEGEKRIAAMLQTHGLTAPQFYVLKTLMEQNGRCPIGQIAQIHGLTNATMTGLVKRLEIIGLVAREKSTEDKRSVVVMLTPEGYARFAAVQQDFMQHLRALIGLLSPEERSRVLIELTRYVQLIMGTM